MTKPGVCRDTGSMPVRRPQLELSDAVTVDWLAGDSVRSQFFNGMSMIFPGGERYFIESLRRVVDGISDPGLREHVRSFIGQESTHCRIHADFNRRLESLGLRNLVEPFIEWRIRHSGWLGPLDHVAITAGVEHFTSLFGEATLRKDGWVAGGHPELQALWKWHAAEEIEHGFIPLEVYRSLGGGYVRRVIWFLYVWVTLSMDVLIQTMNNLHRSGALWRLKTWMDGCAFFIGRGGPLRVAFSGFPRYLRPGYAPKFSQENLQAHAWLLENAGRFNRTPEAPL